jgi:hypothetical protein
MRGLSELFQKMVTLTPNMPEELSSAAVNIDDPRQLAYLIATNIRLDLPAAAGASGGRPRLRQAEQADAVPEPRNRSA